MSIRLIARELYKLRQAVEALEEEMDRRLFGPELLKLLGSPALTKLARSGKLPGFIKSNSYRGKPLSEYAGGWLSKMLPLSGR